VVLCGWRLLAGVCRWRVRATSLFVEGCDFIFPSMMNKLIIPCHARDNGTYEDKTWPLC